MHTIIAYLVYLAISAAFTIWVARTLHENGRVFLVDSFGGNESLADSVNHLLVVGFYLINMGWAAFAMEYGQKPTDVRTAVEFVTWKVGLVMLVLGVMHFLNLAIFAEVRKRATQRPAEPPATYARPRGIRLPPPAPASPAGAGEE